MDEKSIYVAYVIYPTCFAYEKSTIYVGVEKEKAISKIKKYKFKKEIYRYSVTGILEYWKNGKLNKTEQILKEII